MANTPHYDLDTDNTLGGNNASDYVIPSQSAIKYYIDHSSGGIVVDTALSTTSENPVQNKVIALALENKQEILQSGINIKTINGASILGSGNLTFNITSSDVTTALGYTPYDANNPDGFISGITSSDVITALSYTPYDASNPNNYITASALNGYATETYVNNGLATKQDTLVSGTNIKTINDQSILGNGNIDIQTLTSGNGINIDDDDNSIDLIQQDVAATEKYTWSDLTINSNLVNADNVISNFNNNRYITMPDEALTVTSSDEMVFQVRFKKTSFISTMDYLYCAAKTSSNADSGFVIYFNSNNLYVRIGNSSTNKLSYSGLSLNIFYTLNIQYKNGILSGTITDENGTTQALTVISSGATSLIISNIGRFGHMVRTGSGQYLRGAIDLNQTFIKVNDTLFHSTVTGTPAQIVAKATNTLYGLVKPDGTTITVNNGVISSRGIDSTDVINALGYTPYNSTNPAGYISSASISSLTDVTLTNVTNNQALLYNIATQEWENKNIITSMVWGGITGTLADQADLQQTLDGKQPTITGAATTITNNDLTAGRALISDNSGKVTTSSITTAKLGYLSDVTSNIQVQINGKYDTSNPAGYISGITSEDVTTALGYVPYDASNPAEYTSNVGTVTSVNNVSPVNGNVTLSIPDTSNLANKDLSNLSSTGNTKFQAPLVSGTNIKTINNSSILGSGNLVLDGLPSQTGNNGKFLTTDGTDASWANTTKVTMRDWSVS